MTAWLGLGPQASAVVLYWSASGSDAGLCCFDEFGESAAACLGSEDDGCRECWRGWAKELFPGLLKQGTTGDDVVCRLQWCLPALAVMRVGGSWPVPSIILPCESMFRQ
jgi:hypothetical protein